MGLLYNMLMLESTLNFVNFVMLTFMTTFSMELYFSESYGSMSEDEKFKMGILSKAMGIKFLVVSSMACTAAPVATNGIKQVTLINFIVNGLFCAWCLSGPAQKAGMDMNALYFWTGYYTIAFLVGMMAPVDGKKKGE
mmetsp:Transcript_31739/g.83141  ORF Transcript_31739/g.83141 Transcript_31739/m.83141 type:complete len:138 (-) Transcript_31739:164-577(-)